MSRHRADEYFASFCTITVLDWLPVLIEARYIDPIIESLAFSRQHKGLELLDSRTRWRVLALGVGGCEKGFSD